MSEIASYRLMNGTTFSLTGLDADERQLVDDLFARRRSMSNWAEFGNYYIKAVAGFYEGRRLARRVIVSLPVWKIAQDMKGRMMVAMGHAEAPTPTFAHDCECDADFIVPVQASS
ncbi:MAG TPA: hypothetical protein VHR66_23230 [Gemmataceae bacterium]|jgi:hypothetical protein|nr:hypothetical protein [Gemmataceae bacterium]